MSIKKRHYVAYFVQLYPLEAMLAIVHRLFVDRKIYVTTRKPRRRRPYSLICPSCFNLLNFGSVTEIVLTVPSRGSGVSVRVKAMMSKYEVAGGGNSVGTEAEHILFHH